MCRVIYAKVTNYHFTSSLTHIYTEFSPSFSQIPSEILTQNSPKFSHNFLPKFPSRSLSSLPLLSFPSWDLTCQQRPQDQAAHNEKPGGRQRPYAPATADCIDSRPPTSLFLLLLVPIPLGLGQRQGGQ